MALHRSVIVLFFCVNSLLVWKSATSNNVEDLRRDYYRSDTDSLDASSYFAGAKLVIVKRQVTGIDKNNNSTSTTEKKSGSFDQNDHGAEQSKANEKDSNKNSSKNKALPAVHAVLHKAINKTLAGRKSNSTVNVVTKKPPQNGSFVAGEVENEGGGSEVNTSSPEISTNSSAEKKLLQEYEENLHLNKHNITAQRMDYHKYYNSSFITEPLYGEKYWIEIDTMNSTIHEVLSEAHRRAATVQLPFDFPFYGHMLKNITIATGGFLYTGAHVHSWLAATQYIAPLMANFDTSLSSNSTIKYASNDTAFIVQWNKVAMQKETSVDQFTFQVTLHRNGDIVFAYQDVPVVVTGIEDEEHPVKVGLSDAYIIDRTIFFVRRKTIYEYHRVNMKKEEIGNYTAIYFTALPTCISLQDCETCVSENIDFNCTWCHTANRCSDSIDRGRHDWLLKGCDRVFVSDAKHCGPSASGTVSPTHSSSGDSNQQSFSAVTSEPSMYPNGTTVHLSPGKEVTEPSDRGNKNWPKYSPVTEFPEGGTTNSSNLGSLSSDSPVTQAVSFQPHKAIISHVEVNDHVTLGTGGIIGILIVVLLLTGLAAWFGFAYKYPHSSSGQFLIKYRPSQWRWKQGEARYTAASIHM